jgi:hypothetical protein
LKEKRDKVAHLRDFLVMDTGQLLAVVEQMPPYLKEYLKKNDFWEGGAEAS